MRVSQLSSSVLTGVRLVSLVGCCFPAGVRKETVLSVQLNTPIMHHNCSGQRVELTFEAADQEQLEDAARRVFGVAATGSQSAQQPAIPGTLADFWPYFQEARGSARRAPPGGGVQGSTLRGRSYSRKKAQSESHLKSESVSPCWTRVGLQLQLSPGGWSVSHLWS